MIQIESIAIRELRGIRDLTLVPNRRPFVISGPNGSGKSGVVDAIQFGLTGDISRLSGKGTVGLSVQRHGPHVDKRDDPGAAEVSLGLFIPDTGKSVLLTRNVKTSKSFTLTPDDPQTRVLLEDVAQHPELTLSRREIIKYILVEAGERSRQIQALLKLDDVGDIRSVLQTAKNRLASAQAALRKEVTNADDALRRHLDLKKLSKEDILAAVNPHRRLLGLAELTELTADTTLNAGLLESGAKPGSNKQSALRDVAALIIAETSLSTLGRAEIEALQSDIAVLESDHALLNSVARRSFVERGLSLVDGTACPLCDTEWDDIDHLRRHLQAKLAKSHEAELIQQRVLKHAGEIGKHARSLVAMIAPLRVIAQGEGMDALASRFTTWSDRLVALAKSTGTIDDVLAQKLDFGPGWVSSPPALADDLERLQASINAKPDQSASVAAQTFLALAQDRLNSSRSARRSEKQAAVLAERGHDVYQAYCEAMEEQLTALYTAVQDEFSAYYRDINSDDEGGFKAKLEPSEGKLELEVAFYDKGMFPPAAYHSEGHQDGMGVCLYLALMNRVLGARFRFAVLDDVVMSVDQGHRKQFCTLLKTRFPDTQFIITTHDRVWAKQMQTESLVDSKGGVVFHSWSVQTGPIYQQLDDVWGEIDKDLAKSDVSAAAGRLRRHMEYVSSELADHLGAKPTYRGDCSYDFGDLFPAVLGRHAELLKLAAKAAQDWKDDAAKAKIEALKTSRAEVMTKYGGENWIVNKAVHYNEWASFSTAEFKSVVEAFRALLVQFRCSKSGCESWLYVMPRRGEAEALRCRCSGLNFNLKGK